jgi:prepilin-type N-terminal cleavage/methylation domain-containing protein
MEEHAIVVIVLQDKKGLTLVEVLIALVVLLLVSLAMMQTALVSIDVNMINILRDEAVSIAEMRMNQARNMTFDLLVSDGATVPITRNIRSKTGGFIYNTMMTVTNLNADNRRITITVRWNWKEKTMANGNPYTHSISSIVRRQ